MRNPNSASRRGYIFEPSIAATPADRYARQRLVMRNFKNQTL